MITYRCDGCGKELRRHALRYTVEIQVKAAYDKLEIGLVDLVQSHRAEMLDLIEKLRHRDPKEIEETIYKHIRLDLCPACQRAFIRSPLRFHPEQGGVDAEVDIDSFLRSLGVFNAPDDGGDAADD
ncbi:MAG TPA: hypothetical protein PLO37_16945 [Candidatus Hydrogenedentes bacterium]|nr:hypothetical protein [Candidatus Hydrogenedentota bacterium]